MPQTNNGFFLDETIKFTDDQLKILKELMDAGKKDEARKYIHDVMKSWKQYATSAQEEKIAVVVPARMATMTESQLLKEYGTSVGALGGFDMNIFTDALYALIERDNLFDRWNTLSELEKQTVLSLDEILRSKKTLISKVLPAKNSTSQARAEGRWWWFLNEA